MSDHERELRGAPFQATGAGTNAGVAVEQAAETGKIHVATHISGSGDVAAVVTLESPNGTIVWRRRHTAAFVFGEEVYVRGATGQALRLEISASTAACEANLSGYSING